MKYLIVAFIAIGVTCFIWWLAKRGTAGVKSDVQDIGSDAKNVVSQAKADANKVADAAKQLTSK